jgi:RHS repeat-associated protein
LPFNPDFPDPAGSGRFLSAKIFGGTNGNTLYRRNYIRYELDSGNPQDPTEAQDANRRVASSSTVYVRDGGHETFQDLSDWDGLGHYRQVVSGGTFAGPGDRTVTTTYNLNGTADWVPTPNDEWILTTFDSVTTTAAGETSTVQACFERTTGFLKSRRTLVGATPTANDLQVVYKEGTLVGEKGFVKSESYYGGDLGGLANTGVCDTQLPGTSRDYKIDHTYANGFRKTSSYDGVSWKFLDRVVDSTGLVASSKDSAGLTTTYDYDDMGRPTEVSPAGLGMTSIAYFKNPATAVVSYSGAGAAGTETYEFDDFGRLHMEVRNFPGNTSKRYTFYNNMGRKKDVSEWADPNASEALSVGHTYYRNFDHLGRPKEIWLPDENGSNGHKVILSYKGDRVVRRTTRVATGGGPNGSVEEQFTTIERYDHHGRLYQLVEPPSGTGTARTTKYEYDVLGNLETVTQGSQIRTFDYDHRGFLLSEDHPESGKTTYLNYDARGHALIVKKGVLGGDREVQLSYGYDKAERLERVRDTTDANPGDLLVEYTYDPLNNAGRLDTAARHNYWEPLEIPESWYNPTTETYGYGSHGLVTSRTTHVQAGSTSMNFTQSWTYDDMGNVSTVTYPRCVGCADAGPNRTLTLGRNLGYLTTVRSQNGTYYVGSATAGDGITYHDNGMVAVVPHGNGVKDRIGRPSHRMRRPSSIEALIPAELPEMPLVPEVILDDYSYDGSGNLHSIACDPVQGGTEEYRYDGVQRLVSYGTCAVGGGQSYQYDRWGNLTRITTGGIGIDIPVSTTTNRLTGAEYDRRGNVEVLLASNTRYTWDALDSLVAQDILPLHVDNRQLRFAYTADGERTWIMEYPGDAGGGYAKTTAVITIRNLDGSVLSEYDYTAGQFTWSRDYIYRGPGQLLASESTDPSIGRRHYTLNHLGTPILVTNAQGGVVGVQTFFGFGQRISSGVAGEDMLFTGHKRDFNLNLGLGDDLDYMHARYYSPHLARFLSVDPETRREALTTPQDWNRYAYVSNNPLKYVDPNGKFKIRAGRMSNGEHFYQIAFETKPYLALERSREVAMKMTPKWMKKADDFITNLDGAVNGEYLETHESFDEKWQAADFEGQLRETFIEVLGGKGAGDWPQAWHSPSIYAKDSKSVFQQAVGMVIGKLLGSGEITKEQALALRRTYDMNRLFAEAE